MQWKFSIKIQCFRAICTQVSFFESRLFQSAKSRFEITSRIVYHLDFYVLPSDYRLQFYHCNILRVQSRFAKYIDVRDDLPK